MRNYVVISALAACLLIPMAGLTDAGDCGPAQAATCCQPTCCQCTVTKTCKEVVYDEYERTAYKTVFEEVMEKKEVCAIRYVEETEHRPACCTLYEPCVPDGCRPVDPCAPEQTCGMRPTSCIRKVPHTVYRPVCETKTVEVPRIVEKRIPYTVTCLKPRIVCREVPVTVCCPKCCCRPACQESNACDE
jgi:hypothetical protein